MVNYDKLEQNNNRVIRYLVDALRLLMKNE